MNLTNIFINGVVTVICIGISSFFMRRWVVSIDTTLKRVLDKIQEFEIKLAEMPGKYVLKLDCQLSEKNNSDKRANIWQEFNKIKADHSERLTKLETIKDNLIRECKK